jgi:hypothetical protein
MLFESATGLTPSLMRSRFRSVGVSSEQYLADETEKCIKTFVVVDCARLISVENAEPTSRLEHFLPGKCEQSRRKGTWTCQTITLMTTNPAKRMRQSVFLYHACTATSYYVIAVHAMKYKNPHRLKLAWQCQLPTSLVNRQNERVLLISVHSPRGTSAQYMMYISFTNSQKRCPFTTAHRWAFSRGS